MWGVGKQSILKSEGAHVCTSERVNKESDRCKVWDKEVML